MGVQYTGLRVAISLALVALAASALAQTKKAAETDSEMIASALAAAPKTVAEGATIVAGLKLPARGKPFDRRR
jgi:hypothetical protein